MLGWAAKLDNRKATEAGKAKARVNARGDSIGLPYEITARTAHLLEEAYREAFPRRTSRSKRAGVNASERRAGLSTPDPAYKWAKHEMTATDAKETQ